MLRAKLEKRKRNLTQLRTHTADINMTPFATGQRRFQREDSRWALQTLLGLLLPPPGKEGWDQQTYLRSHGLRVSYGSRLRGIRGHCKSKGHCMRSQLTSTLSLAATTHPPLLSCSCLSTICRRPQRYVMMFLNSPSSSISTTATTARRKSHPDPPAPASSTSAALCPCAPGTPVSAAVATAVPPFLLVNFGHKPHLVERFSRVLQWRARSMTIQPRAAHFPRVEILTCWRMSTLELACLRRRSLLACYGPRCKGEQGQTQSPGRNSNIVISEHFSCPPAIAG